MPDIPLGFMECPDEGCNQSAEIQDIYVLPSTDGPVRHVKIRCVIGHLFNLPEIRNYGMETP